MVAALAAVNIPTVVDPLNQDHLCDGIVEGLSEHVAKTVLTTTDAVRFNHLMNDSGVR